MRACDQRGFRSRCNAIRWGAATKWAVLIPVIRLVYIIMKLLSTELAFVAHANLSECSTARKRWRANFSRDSLVQPRSSEINVAGFINVVIRMRIRVNSITSHQGTKACMIERRHSHCAQYTVHPLTTGDRPIDSKFATPRPHDRLPLRFRLSSLEPFFCFGLATNQSVGHPMQSYATLTLAPRLPPLPITSSPSFSSSDSSSSTSSSPSPSLSSLKSLSSSSSSVLSSTLSFDFLGFLRAEPFGFFDLFLVDGEEASAILRGACTSHSVKALAS